jgi:hypothetical protein
MTKAQSTTHSIWPLFSARLVFTLQPNRTGSLRQVLLMFYYSAWECLVVIISIDIEPSAMPDCHRAFPISVCTRGILNYDTTAFYVKGRLGRDLCAQSYGCLVITFLFCIVWFYASDSISRTFVTFNISGCTLIGVGSVMQVKGGPTGVWWAR